MLMKMVSQNLWMTYLLDTVCDLCKSLLSCSRTRYNYKNILWDNVLLIINSCTFHRVGKFFFKISIQFLVLSNFNLHSFTGYLYIYIYTPNNSNPCNSKTPITGWPAPGKTLENLEKPGICNRGLKNLEKLFI